MKGKLYHYPLTIKETDLDLYGHVNNATYFTLLEDARWNLINSNGYGFAKIKETGFGPVVLEASIRYLKELLLHDRIVIESETTSYDGKIAKMQQRMMRDQELCCVAEFVFGLFDLTTRKLVLPSPEWLKGIGFV